MVIVYGTRSGTSDTRLPTPCNHCRQPALVQSDWYRYLHVMFIPTFPVGSGRSVHCEACNNSYEMKGSAPLWTFVGSMLFVLCLLGGGAYEAIKHLDIGSAAASITSAESAPSANAATPATPPAAASPPTPKAAAAPAAAAPSAVVSSKGHAPAGSATAKKPAKKK